MEAKEREKVELFFWKMKLKEFISFNSRYILGKLARSEKLFRQYLTDDHDSWLYSFARLFAFSIIRSLL